MTACKILPNASLSEDALAQKGGGPAQANNRGAAAAERSKKITSTNVQHDD